MQYKNTIEAIYLSLEEVLNLVSGMCGEDEIKAIDIDLAADKLRHIYDLIQHLKTGTVKETGTAQAVRENANVENDVVEEKVEEGHTLEYDFDIQSTEDEPSISVESKKTEDTTPKPTNDEKHVKTKAEIDSRVKPVGNKRYLGETFEKSSHSLNEELSKKINSRNLTEKLASNPISNIGSSLGLNDKFEIIKNLFGGDSAKYEHTMHILNAASNFSEAYDYLANNLGWDMNNSSVQKILELIRRKLIVKKNDE
jgi:hypothetical protein